MTALLAQGSCRTVLARPFPGEILFNSTVLKGIQTSDHSEWLETNNQLRLPALAPILDSPKNTGIDIDTVDKNKGNSVL